MIRINLLKNRGEAARAGGTEVNYETTFSDVPAEGRMDIASPKAMGIKVLLLIGGIIGLIAYESYNIGSLQDQISIQTKEKTRTDKEISEKQVVADKARVLEKQIQDLEARIKSIKDLSRIRLREIKSIAFIREKIPEKVWLNSIQIDGVNLKLLGATTSDDELNKFVAGLEELPIFENVILLKAVEEKGKSGTLKIFEIASGLAGTD